MDIKIISENPDYLVLNKPAGLLMHDLPNRETTESTLASWLIANFPETKKVGDDPVVRPGIVHRLDKDTSGILLVARKQDVFEHLKTLFQEHKIHKQYLALVRGHLERERNVINKPLGINPGTTKRSVNSKKMLKEALTEYHVLERAVRGFDVEDNPSFKSSLLEVFPHTGRTHQIRVHLTSIGHPILGDSLYGPRERFGWIDRLMLHSHSIEFEYNGSPVKYSAPPDKKFLSILQEAGAGEVGSW